VTHPYKEKVLAYCDRLDATATRCQNVNTVVIEDGKRVGYNTDYAGLDALLTHANISLSGKHVVILGSGGAANTARALALDHHANVTMLSRRVKEGVLAYTAFATLPPVDVVILGMRTVGMSGLEALPIVNQIDPSLPVIIVADDETLETERAVRRLKIFYYLVKPVDFRELRDAIRQAVSHVVGHEQGDHTC